MAIEFFYAGSDPRLQAEAVDMLALCFDEWVTFRQKYGCRFPFVEHSFAARESGELLGHVGIMPFEISDGRGAHLQVAGLASVGVHPRARGRNIAHELCTLAAEWAGNAQFDLMLLYTAAARVYEKSSWQVSQSVNNTLLTAPDERNAGGCWKSAAELSDREKSFIQAAYQALPPLAGRVRRSVDGKYFHSWPWFFANPASRFKLTDHGYILQIENVVCEVAAPEGEAYLAELLSGVKSAFLSPDDPAARFLKQNGYRSNNCIGDFGVWHGEVAMQKILLDRAGQTPLYWPLADKF